MAQIIANSLRRGLTLSARIVSDSASFFVALFSYFCYDGSYGNPSGGRRRRKEDLYGVVKELLAACAAEGYRIDEKAGTASGVASGIAFLARVEPGTIEMSVNIPADHLPKLQAWHCRGQSRLCGRHRGAS